MSEAIQSLKPFPFGGRVWVGDILDTIHSFYSPPPNLPQRGRDRKRLLCPAKAGLGK